MSTAARVWLALGAVLIVVGGVAGCARGSGLEDEVPDVIMGLRLAPDPPVFGRPCTLEVILQAADGTPIDGAALEVKGDMTHAGMVPVVVTMTEGDGGVYATPLNWTMAGDWILTVRADLPDGRVAQRQFDVTVASPGG